MRMLSRTGSSPLQSLRFAPADDEDDQGGLRRHVVVFVGGEPVRDRTRLTDAVAPDAKIAVMQALSGG